MADEWIDPVAASLLTAAHKAGLTGKKMDQVTGYAALASQNAKLSKMPLEDARKAYSKLNIDVQNSLKDYFENPEYSQEEKGLVGGATSAVWGGVKNAGGFVMDVLYNYGEVVSSPYRSARLNASFDSFITNKGWKQGERQFDPARERAVDQAYDPNIAKIAKRLAVGDKPGQIISDLATPEEEAAWDKFASGDQTMLNAIRDYHDAKISPGRDWARMIGLGPQVGQTDQGLQGAAYKMVSGTLDLTASLIMDPAVWIAAPLTAAKQARLGVMNMLLAETGNLTRAQKVISGMSKVKVGVLGRFGIAATAVSYGIDAALNIPKVRQAFEKIGPDLAIIGSQSRKVKTADRALAMDRIKLTMPGMTDRAIVYMAQNGVKDADTAKTFFRDTDIAEDIMMGRTGSMQAMLPVYDLSTKIRSGIRSTVRKGLGETKMAEKSAAYNTKIIDALQKGGTISPFFDLQQLKMSRDRFTRFADRALLRDYVVVEGDGVIDSAKDVYSVARTLLGRPQARMVANSFIVAKDAAARRQIIIGLYDNLGEYLGVKATPEGAKAWTAELEKIKNARYSNEMTVDVRTARAIGVTSGKYDPSMIDGVSRATSVNQATERMALPKLQNLLKLQDKNFAVSAISGTLNNHHIQKITDFWSALNLLPRLGIRSVLDESLFHSLTLPVALFPLVLKGYAVGITGRVVRSAEKRTKVQRFDLGERDIGIVARTLRSFFADVDEATVRAAMGDRKVQADLWQQQITKSRFGRMWKFTDNYERDAKYVSDLSRFGLTRGLDDFSNGATAGIVNSLPTERLFDDFSEYANLNIDAAMQDLGARFGKDLREISYTEPEFAVNMLMQLAFRVDGNGEIGRIAVRYMDRPKKAVLEIKKYLQTPEGQKVYQRFDRSRIAGRSIDMDAKDFYLNVRGMLADDAGNLNTSLLNKIRRIDSNGKELISTKHLTVDDMGEAAVAKMLPRRTLGYAFRVPSERSASDMVKSWIDRGFQVADRQLGTLTRTPVYNAYYIGYRRQFAPFEKKFIENQMKINGMTRKAAENMAARRYSEMASNMALNRATGYIDNPNVRSVFAYDARNFARYYRATEDFYRRSARVATNAPNALIRIRMASEGLNHAGFIHEDENGEKYFVFPTDTIMYALASPVIYTLTGEWPKQPMPMQMTGKLKMLTPSVDLESNIPTFSGPLAALGWGIASSLLGITDTGRTVSEAVDTKLFGKYAENQAFFDMITPMIVRRALNIKDVIERDETNAQFMSSAMRSAAFYNSNPQYKMVLDGSATPSDIAQYKADIRATAFNQVLLRNLIGIFSPVSPQLSEGKDVPAWMKDSGVVTLRTEFRDILNAEYEKGTENPEVTALDKYTRAYPGRFAYTISERETTTVGSVKNTKAAVDWIQSNSDIVNKFPEGSVFLMPQMNKFNMDAYMFLKREGYRQSKSLEEYYNQIITRQDENTYYDIKKSAERLAAAEPDYTRARAILADADARAKEFLSSRSYLKLQMQDGGRATVLKERALEDVRQMIESGLVPENNTTATLRKMLGTYYSAKATLDSVTSQSDSSVAYKKTLRSAASSELQRIAGQNPNAYEFYDSVLKRLIEG